MYRAGAFFWLWLRLCSGHNMMCSVTQDRGQTTYSVVELPPAVQASRCLCTWSNESNIVIADHLGNFLQPVMSSNFGTLITSECISNLTFSGTCTREGTAQDYRASCSTSCAPEAQIGDEGNSWIGAVVAVVILLLLVCLLGILCYKCEIWRKCSCSQTGGFYAAVKLQRSQQAADVERAPGDV